MSNSGGFMVSRTLTGDRFDNPQAVRRHKRFLQQQLQRLIKNDNLINSINSNSMFEARTNWDESTLSRPNVVSSALPSLRKISNLTNLDRLMESVTPFPAHCFSEVSWKRE